MDINKDNYEEYFLLFADNELSEQEKNIVEDFVKENSDLQEEFLNIKQSVLKPENYLNPEDKNSLFRHTKKFINYTNYRDAFILYNDNELTAGEKNETESFLSENPSLKNEFEFFLKTRLQPDTAIVFPDKSLLFKERDGGKIVPFRWWQAVAAAVLLGMGTWGGIVLLKKNESTSPGLVKNDVSAKPLEINPVPVDTVNLQQLNVTGEKKSEKHPLKQKQFLQRNTDKLIVKSLDKSTGTLKSKKQAGGLQEIGNMANKADKESPGLIDKERLKNTNEDIVNKNSGDRMADNNNVTQKDKIEFDKNVVPDVVTASYTSDENENSSNYAFYNITSERFSKSKIGSFLHKVKRVIERKISPLNNSKNQREVAVN